VAQVKDGGQRIWWGREGEGRTVYEAALDRVRYTYENFDDVIVSFSGGKDSTSTLHVALEVAHELGRTPVRAVFCDEECISVETADYVRRVAARDDVEMEWYCLPVRHRNACSAESPVWWPWAPEARELWVRDLPPEAITELEGFAIEPPEARRSWPDTAPLLADPHRKTACLLGIRADESMVRRIAVSNKRPDNFVLPTPGSPWFYKVYPIYDWTTKDVWTAPKQFGWDVNATYDFMEMSGISHFQQRCAPPFGDEPMGGLSMWAECFPEIWEKMCRRVPGAATAARYSRTELYSFGAITEPPPGVTWQEHIRLRLEAREPAERAFTAKTIQGLIRRHYRKTSEPILPKAKHPISGISWEYLYLIADRSDLKQRKDVMVGFNHEAQKKARVAYDAERAALESPEAPVE